VIQDSNVQSTAGQPEQLWNNSGQLEQIWTNSGRFWTTGKIGQLEKI
jgi:hypothetical protein